MTVGIMAKFQGGTVCATDSALTTGNHRTTLPHIKGSHVKEGFALYAGVLATVQLILRRAQKEHLYEVILDEKDEIDEDETAEFLLLGAQGRMFIIDEWGSMYNQENYAAIGHGADSARMLLRGMYICNTEEYVTQTVRTIIQIIQEFDTTVYGPVRTSVFYD